MKRLTTCPSHAGTGKTLIGVALARALLAHRSNTLLVITYTNHALDQFLEAILDSGVSSERMLRVGGKSSSARIEELSLFRKVDALRAPGAIKPPMDAAEKARNYALGQESMQARDAVKAATIELEALDWGRPGKVPLLAIEMIVMVRKSGLTLTKSAASAHVREGGAQLTTALLPNMPHSNVRTGHNHRMAVISVVRL